MEHEEPVTGFHAPVHHLAAVWAAKHDAAFVDVVRRHLRYPPYLVA